MVAGAGGIFIAIATGDAATGIATVTGTTGAITRGLVGYSVHWGFTKTRTPSGSFILKAFAHPEGILWSAMAIETATRPP